LLDFVVCYISVFLFCFGCFKYPNKKYNG
jgi:hypothetical protein